MGSRVRMERILGEKEKRVLGSGKLGRESMKCEWGAGGYRMK